MPPSDHEQSSTVLLQWAPRPADRVELLTLLEAGRLLTTGGRRLVARACPSCGRTLLGSEQGLETCTCGITCPVCGRGGRGRGRRLCRRPSGHDCNDHHARVDLAQADTERRAAAGDPDIPAAWQERRDHGS